MSKLRKEPYQVVREIYENSTLLCQGTTDVSVHRHIWRAHQNQKRNEYILMFTDQFSKMTETVPMKCISAPEVVRHFLNYWLLNYCPPAELVVDNKGFFLSNFFIDLFKIMSTENNFTATKYPKINGKLEGYNGTILSVLKTCLADHPSEWDLYKDALTYG